MNGREQLASLRHEFVARAVASAVERYSREASHLNDSQLKARYEQLVVAHRRMLNEMNAELATGIQVPAWKQMAVKDMEAQKQAFEQERFVRSAARQMALA